MSPKRLPTIPGNTSAADSSSPACNASLPRPPLPDSAEAARPATGMAAAKVQCPVFPCRRMPFPAMILGSGLASVGESSPCHQLRWRRRRRIWPSYRIARPFCPLRSREYVRSRGMVGRRCRFRARLVSARRRPNIPGRWMVSAQPAPPPPLPSGLRREYASGTVFPRR